MLQSAFVVVFYKDIMVVFAITIIFYFNYFVRVSFICIKIVLIENLYSNSKGS